MKVYLVSQLILGCLAVGILSGCGMDIGPVHIPDGFAFSVGVNNVNQVLDKKGLYVDKLRANKMEQY